MEELLSILNQRGKLLDETDPSYLWPQEMHANLGHTHWRYHPKTGISWRCGQRCWALDQNGCLSRRDMIGEGIWTAAIQPKDFDTSRLQVILAELSWSGRRRL